MGRPMERVLRQTVVAMRLGDGGRDGSGCLPVRVLHVAADLGGLRRRHRRGGGALRRRDGVLRRHPRRGLGGISLAVFVARHLGRGKSGFHRVGMVGRFLASAGRSVQQVMTAHCQEASDLAGWLELGPAVCEPLLQAFERWDGKGVPGLAGADDLAPAIRLVHLADSVEAFHHAGGAEAALRVARERRGTQFDPALVDCFCARHAEILDGLGGISAWEEVIAPRPAAGRGAERRPARPGAHRLRRLQRPEVAAAPRPLAGGGRTGRPGRRRRSGSRPPTSACCAGRRWCTTSA